ncbi:hypothetical protein UFOVP585_2 [uncultured Caudovirales phage]|uniref:Uncharacterized protein n=1 Tax=uncultured Caudovirales phage TaxID=2100421 RepID=A0A6J5N1N6_9CAUD|nr:hypothetical protein UFOVP585_2 [uncultured Caudovirales phage]
MTQHTDKELRGKLIEIILRDPKQSVDTAVLDDLVELIKQEVLEGRLVELDLLEQALNANRSIHKFKLQRLESLMAELSPQNPNRKEE